MKKIKLNVSNKEILEEKLEVKYKKIGNLNVQSVVVHQLEDVNNTILTTVIFWYGFLHNHYIEFRYVNEELFMVTGSSLSIKFIDEMKSLLKEHNK